MSEAINASVFFGLTYQQLLKCQKTVFKKAESTRADVLLLEINGEFSVLKDYTHSNKGFCLLLAPFLVYREIKALRTLRGIQGIPKLIKKVSSRAFLMEYLPARRIRSVQDELDWTKFIADTESLVAQLHNRGVVHGDLRNATNIMVDQQMLPVFIDFVSAVHRGHKCNPLSALLFKLCLKIDYGAMYKLKSKYAPELIKNPDRAAFEHKSQYERTMRWLSVNGRILIQKLFP